jgi:hypothetical protein
MMDAAIWTAIGLLAATSLGTLFYLGSKIDALGARLDGRIDALASRVAPGSLASTTVSGESMIGSMR